MSIRQQEASIAGIGQSPGCDPKTSKRSSGLFSFFKWFKPSVSRESVTQDLSSSSSCDSLNSITSTGTIASFSFVPPGDYKAGVAERSIVPGPETDTYRARLKQRDKRRENDKDLTLRKKYNLFFNRDTLHKSAASLPEEADNSKSLPLMTRKTMEHEEEKSHRRTNSESSKLKRAGAYCHVKGKRRAPQPPISKTAQDGSSTMSLRRKKRLAPQPPAVVTSDKVINSLENAEKYDTIEYADADVIFNDSLKLDHGILKSAKEPEVPQENGTTLLSKSPRSSYMEAPVSPRPWYKRNLSRDSGVGSKKDKEVLKLDDKYEPVERLPDVQYSRSSSIAEFGVNEPKQGKKKEDKRKSGISFLTNISELDREASEIIKKEHQHDSKDKELEPPPFMRPKQEPVKSNCDSWVSPKRRSARDLIAKFNAITNVTKVTVNSAFFGTKESGAFQKENSKRDYFGKPASISEEPSKQTKTEAPERQVQTKNAEETERKLIDDSKMKILPLMKSESAVIKSNKPENKETPKFDRKSWYCPKCFLENDYWRIICYVCSTIKPYFDDLTTPPAKNNTLEKNKTQISEIKHFPASTSSDSAKNTTQVKPASDVPMFERHLERSKTQIGFSALAKYHENQDKNKKFAKSASVEEKSSQQTAGDKQEERERLKRMLIEMKNSLPKRRHNHNGKQSNRTSIIRENTESADAEIKEYDVVKDKLAKKPNENDDKIEKKGELSPEAKDEKVAEIIVATRETIYENIKVKKTENPKPVKVSSSAQTNAVVRKSEFIPGISGALQKQEARRNFELMRPKDFANIYNVKTEKPEQHIYANLMENKDLFLNMPMKFSEIKNSLANNTDTLEINRLLKRLETAIARGELTEASKLARELAQLKVNCSVVRQKSVEDQESTKRKSGFMVDMYVEDKVSHRGPFPINVTEQQTVAQLKKQVENEFQIPAAVQRWILGKELASDDNATLKDLHVTAGGCSVFLYLVAPANDHKLDNEIKSEAAKPEIEENAVSRNEVAGSSSTNHVINKIDLEQQKSSDALKEPKKETVTIKLSLESSKKENVAVKVGEKPTVIENENHKLPIASATKSTIKLAAEEDVEEYDSRTLKPQCNTWECIMCTFLNPQNSNVCAICATIRNIGASPRVSPAKTTTTRNKRKAPQPGEQKEQHYLQLLNLDNADLVENTEQFECLICLTEIAPHRGVTLRECLHQFCKPCLAYTIEFTEEAEVKCPYRDEQYSCDISLQDREIKALVTPAMYDQFLAKSVAQAENKSAKSFHCKTPDCKGWCIFEDNVNEFHCPVCRKNNCLTCQAIHMGVNCKQYQERMNESVTDEDAKRTKEMLEDMVNKGEAIKCPTCQVILMKKWGCDWLRCSMCKTEICWVTRGPRWGPAGKGDTSGGCHCGVNGVKCHPQCNYCH